MQRSPARQGGHGGHGVTGAIGSNVVNIRSVRSNDYRDGVELLVHKDLRVQFDGNRYCVPQRYVGRRLILKADSSSVAICRDNG
jgi:hypothetical protein